MNPPHDNDFSDEEQEQEVMPGVYVTHFKKKSKNAVSEVDAFRSAIHADVDDFMKLIQGMPPHEQAVQVDFLIDQIKNQIAHLEFSQDQIRLFLEADPTDKDLQEAIVENEPVLERMRLKLARMESYVHGLRKQNSCAALGPAGGEPTAPSNDNDQQDGQEDGMWL